MGTKEELLEVKAKLAGNGDVEDVKNALERLKELPMTPTLLKETKIGLTVSKLRKHKDSDVSLAAISLTKSWQRAAGNVTPSRGNPLKAEKQMAKKEEAGAKKEAAEAKKEKAAATVTPLTGVDADMRERFRKLLEKALRSKEYKGAGEVEIDAGVMSFQIEAALHHRFRGVTDDYKAQYRTISFNLKDKKNDLLHTAVMNGEVTADELAVMTSEQMASKEARERMEKAKKEDFEAAQGKKVEQAETDMFKCGKCKARRCTYFQMQTRSADEPMTTFISCVACGHHWKQY